MLKIFTLSMFATCSLFATTVWAKPKAAAASQPVAKSSASSKKAATVTKKAATVTKKLKLHPHSKFSYALGHNFGSQIAKSLKKGKIVLNPEALLRGLEDSLKGKGPSRRVIQGILMTLRRKFQANVARHRKSSFRGNLQKGMAFLAQNAKKPGVVVLASGLQYKIIKPGTGSKPKATDTVVTHYRGTLIDGTVFDSSYKRGRPAKFPVNGVIRGWVEALQLMKTGAKWKLYIPYKLAYGARGAGRRIGPFSTLIFDIELLKIIKK